MINFIRLLKTKTGFYIRKLVSLRASSQQIASGFSIGVFIGIFPTFGFGALLIFAFATKWKFNVPAALLGTIAGNPLFSPVWIGLTCLLAEISPAEIKLPDESPHSIFSHYGRIGIKYLLGNTAISILFAIISYVTILWIIQWIRNRRKPVSQ